MKQPKFTTVLIGSAGTLEQLNARINQYFYSTITLKPMIEGQWSVHNSDGLIDTCIVIKKGRRFRFEMFTED